MSKTVKIILTVSVVFNILLFSALGGLVFKHVQDSSWAQVRKELSPETRNVMARTFQKSRKDMFPLIRKAKSAQADLIEVLRADEFDKDVFDDKVEELLLAQQKVTAQKIDMTRELASELPVEERTKLAERMAESIGVSLRSKSLGQRGQKRRPPPAPDFKPEPPKE